MSNANTPVLRLDGIRKSFNGNEVLRGISFDVNRHEVVAVLGPSGSGKSMTARSGRRTPTSPIRACARMRSVHASAWSSNSSIYSRTCR